MRRLRFFASCLVPLLVIACEPPDPWQPVKTAARQIPLKPKDLEALDGQMVFVVIHPDRLTVVPKIGPIDDEVAEELELEPDTAPPWQMPLEAGEPPAAALSAGRFMIDPLYEALSRQVDFIKRIAKFDRNVDFEGRIALLVGAGVPPETLDKLMYTAGQAQFHRFYIVSEPVNQRPPPPEVERSRKSARSTGGLSLSSIFGGKLSNRGDETPKPQRIAPPTPPDVASAIKDIGVERPDPLEPVRFGTVREGGVRYRADESRATFTIKAPKDEMQNLGIAAPGTLGAVLADSSDPVLYPSFREAARAAMRPILPGIEMFAQHGKMLNDGIVAAIELALEEPVGDRWPGKRTWVRNLLAELLEKRASAPSGTEKAHAHAISFVSTAILLADESLPARVPSDIADEARAAVKHFLDNPMESKPIGFFTWSDELAMIFRRDRWMMSPFLAKSPGDVDTALVLADAVRTGGGLAEQLAWLTEVYAHLTNPHPAQGSIPILELGGDTPLAAIGDPTKRAALARPSAPPGSYNLWLRAQSAESDFITAAGGPAAGSMQAFIEAVRSGEVNLKPEADRGWYAHQQWSLEALLSFEKNAEGSRLFPNDGYRKRLETAFATLMTMNRETHVKQLAAPGIGAATGEPGFTVEIAPSFTVEPVPTHYLRVARAYRFLRQRVLDGVIGEPWRAMAPVAFGHPPSGSMQERLEQLEQLFYGLYLASSVEAGMRPDRLSAEIPDPVAAALAARAWYEKVNDPQATDPFLDEDVRVMVPMGVAQNGKGLLAWAVIGIAPLDIEIEYRDRPEVELLDSPGEPTVETHAMETTVLMPVFAEVVIPGSAPLARHELRALCDEHVTRDAIEEALKSWGQGASEPTSKGCSSLGGIDAWHLFFVAAAAMRARRTKRKAWRVHK